MQRPTCSGHRLYISTDYISLVNILSGREAVPECLMLTHNHRWVASRALELLKDEAKYQACVAGLNEFRARFGQPGAATKAEGVLRVIECLRRET